MNRYKCHKIVEAGPIASFSWREGGAATIVLNDGEVVETEIGWDLRIPKGLRTRDGDKGWFVRYDDGYESWSPTEAFAKGYDIMQGRSST